MRYHMILTVDGRFRRFALHLNIHMFLRITFFARDSKYAIRPLPKVCAT